MIVKRALLPGTATIVWAPDERLIVLGTHLTRDQGALAIQGLIPGAHPDIVDHWLDQQFERARGVTLHRLSALGVAPA